MTIELDPALTEWGDSPYLRGNYAPTHDELDVADLRVHGEIPTALRGVYMRNGANQAFPPLGKYHIFDGDGMVHAVYLDEGRARYKNRFVESRGLLAERAAGRALYGGLSNFVMPDEDTIAQAGFMKNTANTNIVRHAGRYLALMEGARPTELTRELETIGEYDYAGALHGSMTAHPKWDPTTGELLFFGYSPFPPFVTFHVADASGVLTRSVEIEIPKAVMMHDFVATDRHIVFFDLPAVFDVEAMMSGGTGIRWEPQNGSRIGVLPRDGGTEDVQWFELDPFFVFHFLNGWDADDHTVVVDGCRAERMPTAFGEDELSEPVAPSLHRWTMDLSSGAVKTEQLDDRGGDFPRVNVHREGLANRYGYVATSDSWGTEEVRFTSVTKYDLEHGSSSTFSYGADTDAGEAVFAPDPDGTHEDDGWLLNLVYDRPTGTSSLVIADARDLDAPPVATVEMPHRVPFGFHGNWMPEKG
jgi:carotenoid cleavage dioxygenase-like enzyme